MGINWAKLIELQQKLENYEKIENKEEIRKSYASRNYNENNLDGEYWKEFPYDEKYLVSNKGRIK